MKKWLYYAPPTHSTQEVGPITGSYFWLADPRSGDGDKFYLVAGQDAAQVDLAAGTFITQNLGSANNGAGFRTGNGFIWWGGSSTVTEYKFPTPGLSPVTNPAFATYGRFSFCDRKPDTAGGYNYYEDNTTGLSGGLGASLVRLDYAAGTTAHFLEAGGIQVALCLVYNPSDGKVYYVDSANNVCSVVASTWASRSIVVAGTFPVVSASALQKAGYNAFNNCVYWAPNSNGDIYKFDCSSLVITTITRPTSKAFLGITIHPTTGAIYSLEGTASPSRLYKIDPTTNAITDTGAISSTALGGFGTQAAKDIVYSPLDGLIYALFSAGGSSVVKSVTTP